MPISRRRPPRVAALRKNYDLTLMDVAVRSVPAVLDVDAIVVVPGQGEFWRLRYAIQLFNDHPGIRYLLIAGHTKTEKQFVVLDIEKLRELGLTRDVTGGLPIEIRDWDNIDLAEWRAASAVVKIQADHTLEQSDWLIPLVAELGITSLAVVAPSYHLLRAYLTFVKAFSRLDVDPVPMIPLTVPVPPATPSPENKNDPLWKLIAGELNRIRKYQELGHVATLDELRIYLDWMWANFAPIQALAAPLLVSV